MINLEKIFGLFDKDFENSKEVYVDFTNVPAYWVGMYCKIIDNYSSYGDNLLKALGHEDIEVEFMSDSEKPELMTDEIMDAWKSLTFDRAFSYIKRINIHDKEHIQNLKDSNRPELEDRLQDSIDYYIESEEYEKCALIYKILKNYLDR
jgi:hypothetical protein